MPGTGFLRERQVAGNSSTSDALVGEGLAVAVAAMSRVEAVERAPVGVHFGRRMDEAAAPGAAGPGWAAGLAAGQVRLASAGAAALDTARRAAVGRRHRGMAGMARRAVGFPVRPNRPPAPAARSAHEDGAPTKPAEVAPKSADSGLKLALPDVANREGPEDRPRHSAGQGVVSIEQAGDAGPFAVGAASDVAGEGSGDARPTAPMDQHSDQSAVAQCSGSLVEPEGPLQVAFLVSDAAALGQNVCKVELGRLTLGRVTKQSGERVLRPSLSPPTGRFRAPAVDLLPCMNRSGMRVAGGGARHRKCRRTIHGCEPRRSRLAREVGRCAFGRVIAAWRASPATLAAPSARLPRLRRLRHRSVQVRRSDRLVIGIGAPQDRQRRAFIGGEAAAADHPPACRVLESPLEGRILRAGCRGSF